MTYIPNTPSDVFLVQGTGGGKYLVPHAIGSVTRGVTLTIENDFYFSTDQYAKIKQAKTMHGPIKDFHLDLTRTKRNQDKLSNFIHYLP